MEKLKQSETTLKDKNVEIIKKSVEISKEISNIKLSEKDKELLSQIEKIEKTKNLSGVRTKMYKFEYEGINEEENKKKRTKIRKQLANYYLNILVNFKNQNSNELTKIVTEFNVFYKNTYITNDYSILSIYKGGNEQKRKELELLLKIVKDILKIK